MTRHTNTNRSGRAPRQPSPELQEEGTSGEEMLVTGGDNVRQIGQRPNAFALKASETGNVAADKISLLGSVRQRLAEAVELSKLGGEKAAEAEGIADSQALRLYQARLMTGGIDANELSGMLGDVFGFKPKQDGTPGKTPNGLGESIRKRVVRLVGAAEFATSGDGGAFFTNVDPAKVTEVLDLVEYRAKHPDDTAKGMSIYRAYDKLAEIRKETLAPRPAPWMDPKHVAGLVGKLREAGAVATVMDTPGLETAYSALWSVLTVVGESVVTERQKREEAAKAADESKAA